MIACVAGRVFSYLTEDEVEKMKQEEEKKIGELSRHDGSLIGEDDDDEKFIDEERDRHPGGAYTPASVVR